MNITRIIEVVDTREFAYVDGKLKPLAGTGLERECSRCGRLHEVHAHVELEDGSLAIVGTGCMGAPSLLREARNAASRATRAKKRAAEDKRYAEQRARFSAQCAAQKLLDEPFDAWLLEQTGQRDRCLALQALGGYNAATTAYRATGGVW